GAPVGSTIRLISSAKSSAAAEAAEVPVGFLRSFSAVEAAGAARAARSAAPICATIWRSPWPRRLPEWSAKSHIVVRHPATGVRAKERNLVQRRCVVRRAEVRDRSRPREAFSAYAKPVRPAVEPG